MSSNFIETKTEIILRTEISLHPGRWPRGWAMRDRVREASDSDITSALNIVTTLTIEDADTKDRRDGDVILDSTALHVDPVLLLFYYYFNVPRTKPVGINIEDIE